MTGSTITASLVTTTWLADHLDSPNLRVLDVRGAVHHVTQPDGTMDVTYVGLRNDYDAGHIPGALFVDWTTDIVDTADPVPVQVADAAKLSALFGRLGLTPATHVVIYDQTGSTMATRLWWVLTYAGHTQISLLDGGYKRWTAEARPTTTVVPSPTTTDYPVTLRQSLRTTAEETHQASQERSALLIDARPPDQWRGDVVRSGRAGHIPGAVSLYSGRLFKPEGGFRSDEELKEALAAAGVTPDTPVIAYCGGGVAATGVLFALARTGHHNWANFDGSWNEWGPRAELPAETADSSE